jgi:hypothetical protein
MKHRHNQEARSEGGYRLPVNCFRCSEGCVRLEYGNIIFTFAQPQFLALVEVIGKLYCEMEAERAEQECSHYAGSFVM